MLVFGVPRKLTDDDYIPPELIGLREPITPEQFEELCSLNRKLRLELTSTGELIIVPLTDLQTSRRNADLTYQLEAWTRMDGTGVSCGSGTGFILQNGACRAPDASWFKREKFEHLTREKGNALDAFLRIL
jgi:Uma2 family endonuclease